MNTPFDRSNLLICIIREATENSYCNYGNGPVHYSLSMNRVSRKCTGKFESMEVGSTVLDKKFANV